MSELIFLGGVQELQEFQELQNGKPSNCLVCGSESFGLA
jgi:hypothetical protein